MGFRNIFLAADGRKRGAMIAAWSVLFALSLTILLLVNSAAQYDPSDNQAAEAFLFVNAIVLTAVCHHYLLKRISEAGEILVERIVGNGAKIGSSIDLEQLGDRIAGVRASIWSSMVLIWPVTVALVIVGYIALLSPAGVIMVMGGGGLAVLLTGALGVRAASIPGIVDPSRRNGHVPHRGTLVPAWVNRAIRDFHFRMADVVSSRWHWTILEINVVAVLGLLVAGLVAIGVPVFADMNSETAARLVVAVLALWCLGLGLGGIISEPTWVKSVSNAFAYPLVAVPSEPIEAQWKLVQFGNLMGGQWSGSLTAARGQALLIDGPNGSGLAQLVRSLVTPAEAESATVQQDDSPELLTDRAAQEFLAQSVSLVPAAPLAWRFLIPEPLMARVVQLTELAGVAPEAFTVLAQDPGAVDVSIRRRIALVLALFEQRPILILEDFLSGQDADYQRHFLDVTLPFLRAQGVALVLTDNGSSNAAQIAQAFDRRYHIANQGVQPA